MTFADKVKIVREQAGLTQQQLGDLTGVSKRTIASYETGGAKARTSTLLRLAHALNVSTKFLSDDSCDNPTEDIGKDTYVEEARKLYGARGGNEIDRLLADNTALFAGGEVSQEQKDALFEAIMLAYVTSKEEAKAKFGRKNK